MRIRDGQTVVWIALASLLAVAAAYMLYATRGTTLWFDEWSWAVERRGADLDTFLRPHNGHVSLVPVVIYKLLFAGVGLEHSAPYRAIGIGAHLACVALLFVYAARRVGNVAALLAAMVILFLGPAWQNILWPFQVGSIVSLAAGIGALLALDREDRRGDVAASVLLAVSLASTGLGLVVAAGLLVEIGWGRRRIRDAWIVAAPGALYAVWWLAYQDTGASAGNVFLIPGFTADAAASSVAALTGLTGPAVTDNGATLGWGRPLAAAAAVLVAWRLARMGPIPVRVLTLLAMPLVFWALTAMTRAQISTSLESRYLYVGALLLVLLAVELARGAVLPRRGELLVAAAAGLVLLSNLGDLRGGGAFLRSQSLLTRADLGAVELARPVVRPEVTLTGLPGYPLVQVTAGQYLAVARDLGSPAATPEQIATAPEAARIVADAELSRLHGIALQPSPPGAGGGSPPVVDAVAGGTASPRGGCVRFEPAAAAPAGSPRGLDLTVPPAGLLLTADGGPATFGVRRFAAGFPAEPQGRLAASAPASLRIRGDLGAQPWHVRLTPEARLIACGLQ